MPASINEWGARRPLGVGEHRLDGVWCSARCRYGREGPRRARPWRGSSGGYRRGPAVEVSRSRSRAKGSKFQKLIVLTWHSKVCLWLWGDITSPPPRRRKLVLTRQVEPENRNGRLDAAATPPAETSSIEKKKISRRPLRLEVCRCKPQPDTQELSPLHPPPAFRFARLSLLLEGSVCPRLEARERQNRLLASLEVLHRHRGA
jgi:hypothetical protein